MAETNWEYTYLEVAYDLPGQTIGKRDWEEFIRTDRPKFVPYLNMLGERGWEVVSMIGQSKPSAILLKRPKGLSNKE